MMKYILTCLSALMIVSSATASYNYIKVSDLSILANQTTSFLIGFAAPESDYVAFQMDLTLPEGISLNKEGCCLTNRFDENEELIIGKIGDNSYRLTYTSFSLTPIFGNSGAIINLSLGASGESAGGEATLSNIRFVTSSSNRVVMTDVAFNISVVQIIEFIDATVKSICLSKWDKNGDGELDTGEAASVNSYYYGINFGDIFKGNTDIVSFNELQYFTGLGVIPTNSFNGCTKLRSIKLPDNITNINNYAFKNCSLLSSLVIPNSVTSIAEGAFNGCSALGSLELSENLTTIGKNCFAGCSNLTSLVLPNSVTSIGEAAFNGCSSLISLNLPNKIKMIGTQAFYGCKKLESLNIPNEVTIIGSSAFEGCQSLSTLIIPNSVTSIGSRAFFECSSLTVLDIPSGVTSIADGAFSGCSSLTSMNISSSVTSIGDRAFNGCSNLTTLNIPSSVTSIGEGVFNGCYNISSIVVDTDNTSYDSRNNCNAVIDTEKNTLIVGCKNTTVPSGINSIESYAFSQCKGLTNIVIPSSVTSIGQYAFQDCRDLASIDLPNTISYIGNNAFSGCTSLTGIVIPSSLYNIGDYTFMDCSALTDVVIPSNIVTIGFMAFANCTSLKSIDIPNSIVSMGGYVFSGCYSLTRIKLPQDMTNIKEYAFKGCSSLASIEIPKNVTTIEQYAFKDCNNLKAVLVENPSPISLSIGVFSNTSTTRFYVPDGSLTLYRNAYQWSSFSNISEITKDTELDNVNNAIYAQSSTVSKGGDTTMKIYMKNAKLARDYSFELKLPEGITLAVDNNDNYVYELSSRHNGHKLSVSYERITEVYCFSVQSMYSNAISDKNGVILTLKLNIEENLDETDYDVMIHNAEYTPTSGSSTQSLPYVTSKLTIESLMKGDVNGDGTITAQDASLVLQIVAKKINSGTEGVIYEAADVNGDGQVTAQDASLILQYVAKKISW